MAIRMSSSLPIGSARPQVAGRTGRSRGAVIRLDIARQHALARGIEPVIAIDRRRAWPPSFAGPGARQLLEVAGLVGADARQVLAADDLGALRGNPHHRAIL